ncbi:hypothetical protein RJ639_010525 [Escallonia herrerae]|uniref:TRF2/HOY1 PH-like domain-containing protein n=1 Tax=Escallonia herrerae TaxID=1293975 RepID=A0AA89APF8_9ASTE|nr:hypothetical protein RJ639_010525 [Escallonia herrerae]
MVQLMKTGKISPESQLQRAKMAAVKAEVEDSLEYQHGPLNKRSKLSRSLPSMGNSGCSVPPSQYNPLDEPSPLGLSLRKSPSLLDLIQMRLSQGNAAKVGSHSKKEHKGSSASNTIDKLKASNFPASVLKIGTWEYKSRYEGDLVAKCYFAKHKLVWEVLDGGLKNKIEIQWSDIMALKASYPDDGPGTLDVVLARQPLFFRETNPQPRKHTLWQATSDFTGGQASIQRRHYLQCPQGLLGKHFEKLVQCDPRLNYLSQQAEIMLESPYFEPRISVFDDSNDSNNGYDLSSEERPAIFDLQDPASPSGAQSSSSKHEQQDFVGREHFPQETPSPSSVMDTCMIEAIRSRGAEELKGLSSWDNIKVPGIHPSMSMSDLVSHLEHQISEHRTSNNAALSSDEREGLEFLEEISRFLFTDSQNASTSDEKSIMSRVNSLCCLLQKDPPSGQGLPVRSDNGADITKLDKRIDETYTGTASAGGIKLSEDCPVPEGQSNDVSGLKQATGMSRKDSVGELLLNLPRIASLPQFFFNLSEDFGSQAR